MKTRSPIRWFGGKHFLAPFIIGHMPKHKCYVEPFGGGGHVLTQKSPAEVEVYNDIDDDVVNFLMELKKDHKKMAKELATIPYSRSLYKKWVKESWPTNNFERAVRWFYIQRCKMGVENNQKSGWRHSKEANPAKGYQTAINILEQFSNRFRNVMIECQDFRKIIDTYDGPNTLFYIDPPYRGREFRYKGNFTDKDHEDLANILTNIKGKAIVSYYSDPLIDELYKDWGCVSKRAFVGAVSTEHRRVETELLFMNYGQNQMSLYEFI
ncbi:DNA adenine methylase [Bacillus mycoides]|uniref:DNA adenine methylase n=1 Tax=Bacillus mycoides TaxID=1405 RepID=UPI003D6481CA